MMKSKKTLRPAGALMKCGVVTLMALATGCVNVNTTPICEGTAAATDAHAAALLGASVPDAVVITGDTLIAQLDAGCNR